MQSRAWRQNYGFCRPTLRSDSDSAKVFVSGSVRYLQTALLPVLISTERLIFTCVRCVWQDLAFCCRRFKRWNWLGARNEAKTPQCFWQYSEMPRAAPVPRSNRPSELRLNPQFASTACATLYRLSCIPDGAFGVSGNAGFAPVSVSSDPTTIAGLLLE